MKINNFWTIVIFEHEVNRSRFLSPIYRLIRNSNGLTTIRLIQPNSPQSQHMDDYPSHHSDKGDRTSPMATDLRKME